MQGIIPHQIVLKMQGILNDFFYPSLMVGECISALFYSPLDLISVSLTDSNSLLIRRSSFVQFIHMVFTIEWNWKNMMLKIVVYLKRIFCFYWKIDVKLSIILISLFNSNLIVCCFEYLEVFREFRESFGVTLRGLILFIYICI